MIRKYHNHKPQTTPWHLEEKPPNHHETPGRQTKQSNQPPFFHQDDRNTRMDTKQCTTKHRLPQWEQQQTKSQQQQNHGPRTGVGRGGGGLLPTVRTYAKV